MTHYQEEGQWKLSGFNVGYSGDFRLSILNLFK